MQEQTGTGWMLSQLASENEALKQMNEQLRAMYCRLLQKYIFSKNLQIDSGAAEIDE